MAVWSDIFRLHLFQKTDYVWADLDAYCVRPLEPDRDHVFGLDHRGRALTGILRLPPESDTLRLMLDFVHHEAPIQPWRERPFRKKKREERFAGARWGIETLPWGASGPKALNHFAIGTGEIEHAQPSPVFYPLAPERLGRLHEPDLSPRLFEKPWTVSVHFYGQTKKVLAAYHDGLPVRHSYLDLLCRRHRINPRKARVTVPFVGASGV